MSVPLEAPQDVGTVRFTLDGREVSAATGETILEAASRHGIEIPHLCYTPGMRPDGNCRACVVEIKGERVLAPSCCRAPVGRHGRAEREQPRTPRAEGRRRDAGVRRAGARLQARLGAGAVAALARHRQAALRAARAARARRLASRDGGQPRCLHPVHALRARLPRGAGQRRDRLRVSRRALEDRVRPRRSDGGVDVRRVRRVRAGLSRPARWRRPTMHTSSRRTGRSIPCVRTAASAASSPTT